MLVQKGEEEEKRLQSHLHPSQCTRRKEGRSNQIQMGKRKKKRIRKKKKTGQEKKGEGRKRPLPHEIRVQRTPPSDKNEQSTHKQRRRQKEKIRKAMENKEPMNVRKKEGLPYAVKTKKKPG